MARVEISIRHDRAIWREVEGKLIALDLDDSAYLTINGTGRLLWTALAEGATRETLIDQLIRSYEVDCAAAAVDVDAFLAELRARDLLCEQVPGLSPG